LNKPEKSSAGRTPNTRLSKARLSGEAREEEDALLAGLAKPFHECDLKWRGLQIKERNGVKEIRVVPYVDARSVHDRLNEVCGWGGWCVEHFPLYDQTSAKLVLDVCRILIAVKDGWIWREDCSEPTNYEPVKGCFSKAFVRAGVQFGIGAWLYRMQWVTLQHSQGGDRYEDAGFRWATPRMASAEAVAALHATALEKYGEEAAANYRRHNMALTEDQADLEAARMRMEGQSEKAEALPTPEAVKALLELSAKVHTPERQRKYTKVIGTLKNREEALVLYREFQSLLPAKEAAA
jgi:hypothetical protein